MEESLVTKVFLPAAIGIVMLGLGLTLTLEDFKRVLVYPKAVIVGLACQMLILPAVCFGIAKLFKLPPELAVGLMLLAASPGGATANLFSHLAKGDVALNITLTAVNSVLSLVTMPFIVNFALVHFLSEGKVIPLQLGKILSVFAVVLIPVIIGMMVRRYKPAFADKMEKPVRIVSAVVLIIVILGAIVKERANVVEYFKQVGLAALTFNLASLAVGYFIPLLARVPRKQAIAIGMEIGIHNGTLAIAIAVSVLGNSTMSVPPAIYSLIMFFTAAAFGYVVSRNAGDAPKPKPA